MNQVTVKDEVQDVGATSLAIALQRSEIDQLVSTARAYPRSLKRVQSAILSMATLDEESAEECMYALPRGGKPIKGPSIRFAEILKQSYGNCHAAARVVHVDRAEKFVEAEGVFVDLETNARSTARVRRRIVDKNGRIYNDDMIIVTGNAACSIAMRNAILSGVPKPIWRSAWDTIQATITGDVTTLAENREKALKALAAFGVSPEKIFASLAIAGIEDIGVDHIATLRGMYAALKNGEATVEEMFSPAASNKQDQPDLAGRLKAAQQAADGPTEGFVANPAVDAVVEEPEPETATEAVAEAEEDTATETSHSEADGSPEADTPPPPSTGVSDGASDQLPLDVDGPQEGPTTQTLVIGAVKAFLMVAKTEGTSGTAKLIEYRDYWKPRLPVARHEVLAAAFRMSQALAKGELDWSDAYAILAEKIGCEPEELEV